MHNALHDLDSAIDMASEVPSSVTGTRGDVYKMGHDCTSTAHGAKQSYRLNYTTS